MDTKLKCSTCKEEKSTNEFTVDRSTKRGFQYTCKSCVLKHRQKPSIREKVALWERNHREAQRIARRNRRIDAIGKLGGKCECCGETKPEFLAIDHIGGLSKRNREDSGDSLISKVRRSGFSKDIFRVLCHNCNSALGFYGYCPHKTKKDFLTR